MAWNVFKFCTILRVAGSLMVFVVMGVIAVSYYALVFATYLPNLFKGASDSALSAFILILFHLLLFMLLWCYFSVVLTDPGGVPPAWTPTTDENDLEAETVPLSLTPAQSGALLNSSSIMYSKLQNQKIRFCRKCCQFKPPRCHHCSVCGRCILKMDHHCVWVVNCVGARNYKAFLLFLLYTFLETTLAASVLLPYFIAFFSDVEEDAGSPGNLAMVFLGFVLNLAFALSVLGFMIMHASLVAGNTTTIEAYEKKKFAKWKYDLGRSKNFEQVFGTNKLYWLIPLYSEEDLRRMPELQGLEYPCKPDISGDNF